MLPTFDEIPAVKFLFPLSLGIMAGTLFLHFFSFWWCLTAFGISALLFLILDNRQEIKRNYRLRWLIGSLIFGSIVFASIIRTHHHKALHQANHFSHYLAEIDSDETQILVQLQEKANSYKILAEVLAVNASKAAEGVKTCGKAILYFAKGTQSKQLKYGQQLILKKSLQTIAPPANPHQFDYQRYLAFQNIHHQVFLQNTDYQVTDTYLPHWFWKRVYGLQAYLKNLLHNHVDNKESLAVATALLLGDKKLIDRDLQDTYADTGAMHVLAVSGLHVGIFTLIINGLFKFLPSKKRRMQWVKFLLSVAAIWGFATVTGLSASVSRAALMFSIIQVGVCFHWRAHILNTVAVSAIILLCINPYFLFQVGFQLSYLALTAIVVLQPYFDQFLDFKGWLPNKMWQATTVSFAAQIGTLPLSLYYFDQFPVYAFLSNFVVMLGAFVAMITGLSFFALGGIAPLGGLLGDLLNDVLFIQNMALSAIQSLPFSVIEPIFISFFQMLLLGAFVVLMTLFLFQEKSKWLKWALGIVVVFAATRSITLIQQHKQQAVYVYQLSKGSMVELVSGKTSVIWADSLGLQPKQVGFNVASNWVNQGIDEHYLLKNNTFTSLHPRDHYQLKKYGFIGPPFDKTVLQAELLEDPPFYQFNQKRIAILDAKTPAFALSINKERVKIDLLVLTQNTPYSLSSLTQWLDPKQIVVDKSNFPKKRQLWQVEANGLGISYHDVAEQGAFVTHF